MIHLLKRCSAAYVDADVLVIPGRGGSGADHWQSHFERGHGNARRVVQDDWDTPDVDAWARRIAAASVERGLPVLAVAHSFGCLALARAILAHGAAIEAALLVAPADPARFAIPRASLRGHLGAPTLLVASDNDPWLSARQARALATDWGSRYLNLGPVGHINVAAGFGAWPACGHLAELVWQERRSRRRIAARGRVRAAAKPAAHFRSTSMEEEA